MARFDCPLVPTPPRTSSSSASGVLGSHQDHRVPRAPLPGLGVTHHQGDVSRHLRGHYASFPALTGSCARPPSSPRLGGPSVVESVQVVASPCWTMVLPDIISAICVEVLGPIPRRVRRVRLPISSPATAASRHGKHVRHTGEPLQGDFHRERSFRGCSHSLMFRLPHLLGLQIAPTAVQGLGGQAVYTTHRPKGYPPRDVVSLHV